MSVVGKLAVKKPLDAHVVATLFLEKDRRPYSSEKRKRDGAQIRLQKMKENPAT